MKLNRVILTADALLLMLLVACEDGLFKRKGTIEVQSTPEGAEVYLNEEHTGEATNCVLDDIEPGEYAVKLTLAGYWDWESNVTVKAGDTAFVHALFNIEEGTLKWKYEPEGILYGPLRGSPAIGPNGTIYYFAKNALRAINPDGTEKWSSAWENNLEFFTPVVASDENIYIKVADFETNTFQVYAFTTAGYLNWHYSAGPIRFFDADISPVIGSDGTIYFASDDSLFFALKPQGGEKWEYKIDEGSLFSSAAIGSDGTIYFTVQNGYSSKFCLYALTPQGSLRWKREGISGSPVIGADGTIYLYGNHSNLQALNPDGSEKWELENIAEQIAIGSDGTIYASHGSNVNAISPNGIILWQYHPDDDYRRFNYPIIGSDGVIYLGASDGYFYALNPDCSLRWKCYIGGVTDGSPAIADDGTIYCATQDGNLYAITSSSRGLASSPWPKFAHDNQNTGRAGAQ